MAWVRTDLGADVPTPAVRDDRIVVCTDKGKVECVAAATGKTLFATELPKNRSSYSASPVIVDGRVIVTREDGESSVLAWPTQVNPQAAAGAADFKLLGQGIVDEMTVATPVCVDGRIFLRTHDSLWCLGEKQ